MCVPGLVPPPDHNDHNSQENGDQDPDHHNGNDGPYEGDVGWAYNRPSIFCSCASGRWLDLYFNRKKNVIMHTDAGLSQEEQWAYTNNNNFASSLNLTPTKSLTLIDALPIVAVGPVWAQSSRQLSWSALEVVSVLTSVSLK